jgi:hypothetical protein
MEARHQLPCAGLVSSENVPGAMGDAGLKRKSFDNEVRHECAV